MDEPELLPEDIKARVDDAIRGTVCPAGCVTVIEMDKRKCEARMIPVLKLAVRLLEVTPERAAGIMLGLVSVPKHEGPVLVFVHRRGGTEIYVVGSHGTKL